MPLYLFQYPNCRFGFFAFCHAELYNIKYTVRFTLKRSVPYCVVKHVSRVFLSALFPSNYFGWSIH